MAGELTLTDQVEQARRAVEDAEQRISQLLRALMSDVDTVQRRWSGESKLLGSAPGALAGRVRELDRWHAVLLERRSRLRALESWGEGS